MARTTSQPSTTTRRNNRTTRPDTNGLGSLNEQDQRDEGSGLDNDERRDGLSAVREEQDNGRRGSRDERKNSDDERGFSESRDRDERNNVTGRDERNVSDEDSEDGARRAQRPAALAAGMDTFAPVLEAWKQVFASWTELTETMVKVQQDTFAKMISAANTHARDLDHDQNHNGENNNGEHAFSGSRTTASTPERIGRDRR